MKISTARFGGFGVEGGAGLWFYRLVLEILGGMLAAAGGSNAWCFWELERV